MIKQLLSICALLSLFSCDTSKRAFYHDEEQDWQKRQLPTDLELEQTLFLTGGVGEGDFKEKNIVLPVLQKELEAAGKKSTIVFLGDNAPAFNRQNKKAEVRARKILSNQLDILENHEGKAYFIPGEKDWNNGKRDGREALLWQADYIEERLGKKNIFLPNKACGDPDKEKISDGVRLLFADSQWWLQDWDQINDINEGCDFKDRFGFLLELEDDMKKYDKDRVVLLMHHPFLSNGKHGSGFTWKQHLFPLTIWKKNAYVPLPGLGSLVVMAKEMGISRQDVTHPRYVRMRQEILNIANKKPENKSLIIVGAHDNSLQYFEEGNDHIKYIVSGSAGKAEYAQRGRRARFVQAKQGYAKLYFYKNQETWLEMIAIGNEGAPETVFRKKLFDGVILSDDPPKEDEFAPMPDSITVAASKVYDVGLFKKTTFGDRYRRAWKTPVRVPVFNLETEFKDLTPVKQGGGMSSKSLRFESTSGKEYVLRSVDKDVSRGLPKDLRETLVQDFIQDLKSGSHPYAAFAVPALAEAAGIYHTNPRLFYLPKQRRLGAYNESFAGELYLFEERPDDDHWGDSDQFDHSPDIISYVDLLDKIHKSPKHQIDEKWALRSRLFDQFIHDYDRHDDQWRWASFPQNDDLILYRPIPRDRDQAFFDLRGVVPFIISRRFLRVQQRGFTGKIRDVPGEAKPGSVFDRTYITELDRADWLEVAREMQAGLTDEVIENAFKNWPPEVYGLNTRHIIKVLKKRRDNIPYHAEKLYAFYAKYVDVTGTNKNDLFEVKRKPGGVVSVEIFSLKKDGEREGPYYQRDFLKNETREIRLYGLDGDDQFLIDGEAKKSIRIRVLGGNGQDEAKDETDARKTVAYDTPDGIALVGHINDQRHNGLKVNEYDRNEFRYNTYFPLFTFGRTVDDGALFGGGVRLTRYHFRKEPYGSQHSIFFRFSANTNALNFYYTGDFTRAIGHQLDFNPDIHFDRPIIFNFFGLGNGTQVDQSKNNSFNWVRLEKMSFSPLLKRTWYNGRNFTRFGPFFERVEVQKQEGRITDTDLFSANDLEAKNFLGLKLEHSFQSVDNGSIPRNGFKLNFGIHHYYNLLDKQVYTRLFGNVTTYFTVGSKVELTFASRFGLASLTNKNFLFYHSNNLGGNNYLRGFRNNRFSGQSLLFHNTDLRLKLFYWRNNFIPFEFGVMGGFDYGRVWEKGSDPEKFHAGVSPGFWITPFKMAAISTFYTFTNGSEDDTYTIRLGFFF